jgi:hypothetical protein
MSVHAGPNTVEDGLVLSLDAANGKSYPGTGTNWNDLSVFGNNGTLQNGVTFDSESQGCFLFNRNTFSEYVSFVNTTSVQFLGRLPYTLEVWVYPNINPGASTFTGIFNREDSSTGSRDGYNIYLNGSTTTAMQFVSERFQGGVNRNVFFDTNESTVLNKWNHLCCTYDGTNLILYYNTTIVSSRSDATGNINNSSKSLEFGRRGAGSYFGGKLAAPKIYNRALTPQEVQQNFQALRGRFGI